MSLRSAWGRSSVCFPAICANGSAAAARPWRCPPILALPRLRGREGKGKRRPEKLEPISKSPEEDNEASELYEAEEVLGVVFPTDEDAALPLNPSKEALHEPASHIAA